MKNLIRLLKSMIGIEGSQSKQTDLNMASFAQKANLAKMKVENLNEYRKTQTYYIAKGMGILRKMEVSK